MRQIGLLCSEKMLETDTKSFLDFFAKIKKETNMAGQKLEALKQEKMDATKELKAIMDQCSTEQSKINKNLETMLVYMSQKDFLDELTPQYERERLEKVKREKALARQKRQAQLKQQEDQLKANNEIARN